MQIISNAVAKAWLLTGGAYSQWSLEPRVRTIPAAPADVGIFQMLRTIGRVKQWTTYESHRLWYARDGIHRLQVDANPLVVLCDSEENVQVLLPTDLLMPTVAALKRRIQKLARTAPSPAFDRFLLRPPGKEIL